MAKTTEAKAKTEAKAELNQPKLVDLLKCKKSQDDAMKKDEGEVALAKLLAQYPDLKKAK